MTDEEKKAEEAAAAKKAAEEAAAKRAAEEAAAAAKKAEDDKNLQLRFDKMKTERDTLLAEKAEAEKKRLEEQGNYKAIAEKATADATAATTEAAGLRSQLEAANARIAELEGQANEVRKARIATLREAVKALPETHRELVLPAEAKDEEIDLAAAEAQLARVQKIVGDDSNRRPGGFKPPDPANPKDVKDKADEASLAAMSRRAQF